MKVILFGCLGLFLLSGCSGISARKRENSAAFASLPPSERAAVEHGRIENGMSTNAVFIAWGAPSSILPQPVSSGGVPDETWIYYGDRPVLVPRWVYLPTQYGYWQLEYSPDHYSVRYIKGEVRFQNGRVAQWTRD